LPAYEIVAIVRSAGLEPLHRPLRQGQGYVLRAVNPAGREVRVIVDAESGRIVRITTLPGPKYPPPVTMPYERPPSRGVAVPDGHGPRLRIPAPPAEADAAPPAGRGIRPAPSQKSAAPMTPPLPRPRPEVATTERPAATAAPAAAKDTQAPTPAPPPGPAALPVEEAE
jgi:hypothetical protein